MKERRKHSRKYPGKYDYNYACYVQYGERKYPARLLDVSQGGARFYIDTADSLAERYSYGKILGMSDYSIPYFEDVPYTVVWQRSNQLGVIFDTPLPYGYRELDKDFSPNSYTS